MSSDQIKEFFTIEDKCDYKLSPIKEYVNGKNSNATGTQATIIRVERVERILSQIIVARFINGSL